MRCVFVVLVEHVAQPVAIEDGPAGQDAVLAVGDEIDLAAPTAISASGAADCRADGRVKASRSRRGIRSLMPNASSPSGARNTARKYGVR